MKIGLSFSRCVRDIVEGKVDILDVLVIVARTDFDPHNDEQWGGIWRGYSGGNFLNMNMEWGGYSDEDEQKFRDVSCQLMDMGKLHQPRQFGAHPRRLPYYWLETIVSEDELETSPAVKDAWEKFKMVSGLRGTSLEKHYE
jgi:hypothetical protein